MGRKQLFRGTVTDFGLCNCSFPSSTLQHTRVLSRCGVSASPAVPASPPSPGLETTPVRAAWGRKGEGKAGWDKERLKSSEGGCQLLQPKP